MNKQLLLSNFKFKFKAFLEQKLFKLESEILSTKNPTNAALLKSFANAVTHLLLNGESSLTRPLLVFSSCHYFNVSEKIALEISFCIELIHSMSLIIDDLPSMDNADIRRGYQTTHKVYGEGQAILAAFSLYTYALKIFSTLKVNNLKATHMLFTYLQNVIRGQAIDISLSPAQADTAIVDEMHILKTGCLIRVCIVVPALLSPIKEISSSMIGDLEAISDMLGLAYQIRDDLLDALTDSVETGKSSNLDEIQQKPSYVHLTGIECSMNKLIEIFAHISSLIQSVETTNEFGDLTLLKLLIEQVWIKSLELKTFFPVQSAQLEQHASLIANGLKMIGRNDSPAHYLFYYAYGICFPIYSPDFSQFIVSLSCSPKQIDHQLMEFIRTNYRHNLLLGEEYEKNNAEDSMAHILVKLKEIQTAKLGTLISLAAGTQTFLKNPAMLQLITDFTAYIMFMINQPVHTEKWSEFNQKILNYFRQDGAVNNNPSEYNAVVALALRIRTTIKSLYGEKINYEAVMHDFLVSLGELLAEKAREKHSPLPSLNYDELNKRQKILTCYQPIIQLSYILLGIPQFHHHATLPIRQLEELALECITKINAFLFLRVDLTRAGIHLRDISQWYITDQPLKVDSRLSTNLIILRAWKYNCSLKQAIFQELADYAKLIDKINSWIEYYAAFCTPLEVEALMIHRHWASFANALSLLMNEQCVGNHELVHRQFQDLCLQNIQKDKTNHQLKTLFWNHKTQPDLPSTENINNSYNLKAKL